MNIHITLVTYAIDITPLWKAAIFNSPAVERGLEQVTWHAFNHGASDDIQGKCEYISSVDPDFHFYNYRQNRGLARSWNEGLLISQAMDADVMIIINDDVTANADDIMVLANAAVTRRDAGIIVCEGYNKRMVEHQILGHAVFAVNPIALHHVGYFDENYWPIYGEDTDYSRRCHLAGVTYHNAGPTGMVHIGSATVNTAAEIGNLNQITFPKNAAYHTAKWGGTYGAEQWAVPFGDGRFNLKISAEDRHAPYEGHNRDDITPA